MIEILLRVIIESHYTSAPPSHLSCTSTPQYANQLHLTMQISCTLICSSLLLAPFCTKIGRRGHPNTTTLMAGVRPVHSSLIAGWFVFIRSDYKLLTDAHFSFKMSLCVHTKYIYFVVAVAFNSTMFPEKIATFLCI